MFTRRKAIISDLSSPFLSCLPLSLIPSVRLPSSSPLLFSRFPSLTHSLASGFSGGDSVVWQCSGVVAVVMMVLVVAMWAVVEMEWC